MVAFSKPVLSVGRYRTRSGEWLDATADRLQGWAHKFQRMKARGIKVPLTWSHNLSAEPCEDSLLETREYWKSALNAGYLNDMHFDHKSRQLVASGEAPGCDVDSAGNLLAWTKMPDGRMVRSAVSECSLGVRNWTDGSGHTWADTPIHLALCVLPVGHGLPGFKALSTAPGDGSCHCPPGTALECGLSGCRCRPIPATLLATVPGERVWTGLSLQDRLRLAEIDWTSKQSDRMRPLRHATRVARTPVVDFDSLFDPEDYQ